MFRTGSVFAEDGVAPDRHTSILRYTLQAANEAPQALVLSHKNIKCSSTTVHAVIVQSQTVQSTGNVAKHFY